MSDEHTATSISPAEADPKSSSTFVVGTVGVALLIVVGLLLEALFHRTNEAETYRKVIAAQPEELRRVQAEQLEQLQGYRWVDQQNGVVTIPIERAMRLVIDEATANTRDKGRMGE